MASASASFSICAYLCSVLVVEHEAYVTGLHLDSVSLMRTAPRPYEDESALSLVGASGS